jgi:hypothetical protein
MASERSSRFAPSERRLDPAASHAMPAVVSHHRRRDKMPQFAIIDVI